VEPYFNVRALLLAALRLLDGGIEREQQLALLHPVAWLDPLLDEIARQAPLLLKGDDAGFMNKLALAMKGDEPAKSDQPAPAGQSHIRQARPTKPQAELPKSGPMADMLNKLFGKGE